MAEETANTAKSNWQPPSWLEFLRATIPIAGFGYLFVLFYEAGFSRFFGIPASMIIVGPGSAIRAALWVMAAALALSSLASWLIERRRESPVLQASLRVFAAWTGAFAVLVIAEPPREVWLFPWIVSFVVFVTELGLPSYVVIKEWARGRLHGQVRASLCQEVARRQLERKNSPPLATHVLERVLGKEGQFLIVMTVAGVMFAFGLGQFDAWRQETYPIVYMNDGSEEIVLRIYGDNLIVAKYDRLKKEVEPAFSIVKVADNSRVFKMHLDEGVGPLRPRGGLRWLLMGPPS